MILSLRLWPRPEHAIQSAISHIPGSLAEYRNMVYYLLHFHSNSTHRNTNRAPLHIALEDNNFAWKSSDFNTLSPQSIKLYVIFSLGHNRNQKYKRRMKYSTLVNYFYEAHQKDIPRKEVHVSRIKVTRTPSFLSLKCRCNEIVQGRGRNPLA